MLIPSDKAAKLKTNIILLVLMNAGSCYVLAWVESSLIIGSRPEVLGKDRQWTREPARAKYNYSIQETIPNNVDLIACEKTTPQNPKSLISIYRIIKSSYNHSLCPALLSYVWLRIAQV